MVDIGPSGQCACWRACVPDGVGEAFSSSPMFQSWKAKIILASLPKNKFEKRFQNLIMCCRILGVTDR